jgi:hypothetical protein
LQTPTNAWRKEQRRTSSGVWTERKLVDIT